MANSRNLTDWEDFDAWSHSDPLVVHKPDVKPLSFRSVSAQKKKAAAATATGHDEL